MATSTSPSSPSSPPNAGESRVTKKRFFILITVSFLTLILSVCQPHYASITNILTDFYGVSDYWINFISTSGLIVAIVSTVPMNCIAEKFGIKFGVIVSTTLLVLASITIYISVDPRFFWLAVLSNALKTLSTSYLHTCQTQVAFTWFPDNEKNYAYTLLHVINSLGLSLGMFISPSMVKNIHTKEEFITDFRLIGLVQSIVTISLLIFIIAFFDSKPKIAPSDSREEVYKQRSDGSLKETMISLVKNKDVMLLFFSTSLVSGTFLTLVILLNQVITAQFDNDIQMVGTLGLLFSLSTLFSYFTLGFLTKRYKRLKLFYSLLNVLTLISTILFVITFIIKSQLIYVTYTLCGLFSNCNAYLSMLLMAELAYPHSEAITSALVYLSIMLSPNLFTFLGTKLIVTFGSVYCLLMLTACLFVAIIIDCFIKERVKKSSDDLEMKTKISNEISKL